MWMLGIRHGPPKKDYMSSSSDSRGHLVSSWFSCEQHCSVLPHFPRENWTHPIAGAPVTVHPAAGAPCHCTPSLCTLLLAHHVTAPRRWHTLSLMHPVTVRPDAVHPVAGTPQCWHTLSLVHPVTVRPVAGAPCHCTPSLCTPLLAHPVAGAPCRCAPPSLVHPVAA